MREATAPARPQAGRAADGKSARLPFLDFLRAVASHLIVWHHLVFYGPLSDAAYVVVPLAFDALYDYGRMAVQVFFVLGGFTTARTLARSEALDLRGIGAAVWKRYRRIGFPYLVTLALAVGANALASRWMDHPSISAPPTVPQLLAHATFLQHLLGYEALTAGIWYLAVDFQLGLITLFVAAGCSALVRRANGRIPFSGFALSQALFWPLALASLFWFNRDAALENWAIYFFGAFFLGMVLQWSLAGALARWTFWAYAAAVVAAGVVDSRPRLLVAAGTALLVQVGANFGVLGRWPRSRGVAYLGRISYSLFLVHFPVCLVVNAFVTRDGAPTPAAALGGMFVAWALSIVAAVGFHHGVEARFLRDRVRPKPDAGPGRPGSAEAVTGS